MLHDTTELTFHRNDVAPVGILHQVVYAQRQKRDAPCTAVCGIQMQSSLAVTTGGLSLGLAAIKFWTREEFKGCNALKKRVNPTRVPIERKESFRWLENVRQSTALFEHPERYNSSSAKSEGQSAQSWRKNRTMALARKLTAGQAGHPQFGTGRDLQSGFLRTEEGISIARKVG